jgi:hypothetical protein
MDNKSQQNQNATAEKNVTEAGVQPTQEKPAKPGIRDRARGFMARPVVVGDVVKIAAGAVVVGVVWEGARFALRNKVALPGLVKYSAPGSTGGTVLPLKRVA